jgi:uncharacterized protein (DUF924 family)
MTAVVAPDDVLHFWFGAPGSAEHGRTRPLWFTKSADTDAEIRNRFGATVEAALRGDLDGWAGGGARGALALIVVLDQFTRNVYRDSAHAFAGDARALALARQMVAAGADRGLPPLERWFAYLPFEHSEDLADQRESLRLFGELAQEGLAEPLVWARKHFDVVERFGRYPHRNELLGRASTAQEIEFLRQPGSRF